MLGTSFPRALPWAFMSSPFGAEGHFLAACYPWGRDGDWGSAPAPALMAMEPIAILARLTALNVAVNLPQPELRNLAWLSHWQETIQSDGRSAYMLLDIGVGLWLNACLLPGA